MCRVGRCQLDPGLPGKQLCRQKGQEVVGCKGGHQWRPQVPNPGNCFHLTNENHLFCKCVKWVPSGEESS